MLWSSWVTLLDAHLQAGIAAPDTVYRCCRAYQRNNGRDGLQEAETGDFIAPTAPAPAPNGRDQQIFGSTGTKSKLLRTLPRRRHEDEVSRDETSPTRDSFHSPES
jgi:hypothetical protein